MKKKIVALTLIICLSIFPLNAFALERAVCNGSPDGIHHYEVHRDLHYGYTNEYTHKVLDGISSSAPVYTDCYVTQTFEYCERCCKYCGAAEPGSIHVHLLGEHHSINH